MERVVVGSRSAVVGTRIGAVIAGAVLVAAAAQVAVPLPGTPVPMTLQPLAVLLVGGLLGARLGAASLILYLALGAAGLPVFTPTVPLTGIARLLGPTGGYLLAYPFAAFVVGWLSDFRHDTAPAGAQDAVGAQHAAPLRVCAAVIAGLALIHLGGLAQLAILTGDISTAARFGTWPFLLGDLVKLTIAVAVLTKLTPTIRARL